MIYKPVPLQNEEMGERIVIIYLLTKIEEFETDITWF